MSLVSCEHWHLDISVLWYTLTPGGVVGTWCGLWTSIHFAWHWLPLNLNITNIESAMRYTSTVNSHYPVHAMKLTGCCTSISFVSHVYMSTAYCEQYRILFHIKMRDIVQNKVDRSIIGFIFVLWYMLRLWMIDSRNYILPVYIDLWKYINWVKFN